MRDRYTISHTNGSLSDRPWDPRSCRVGGLPVWLSQAEHASSGSFQSSDKSPHRAVGPSQLIVTSQYTMKYSATVTSSRRKCRKVRGNSGFSAREKFGAGESMCSSDFPVVPPRTPLQSWPWSVLYIHVARGWNRRLGRAGSGFYAFGRESSPVSGRERQESRVLRRGRPATRVPRAVRRARCLFPSFPLARSQFSCSCSFRRTSRPRLRSVVS